MLWEPPASEEELLPHYEDNVKAWQNDKAYCLTIEAKGRSTSSFESPFVGKTKKGLGPRLWTHPEKQGNGYTSEAVQVIIAFGFRKLGAETIIAAHAVAGDAGQLYQSPLSRAERTGFPLPKLSKPALPSEQTPWPQRLRIQRWST